MSLPAGSGLFVDSFESFFDNNAATTSLSIAK